MQAETCLTDLTMMGSLNIYDLLQALLTGLHCRHVISLSITYFHT